MNKGFVKSTYKAWLISDKQIFTAVSFICLYMYTISPIIECAALFGEPINLIEVYLTFIGNGFCIPLIIISFLISIIDFPDISANVGFVLIRLGRRKWYCSQLLFLLMSIAAYIALLFVFSVVFTFDISFIINGWSNTIYNLQLDAYADLKKKYPLANIDLSVLNNFRPYSALVYSLLLTALHLLFCGQLQMWLSIKLNRIVGICVSVGILGVGLVLWVTSSNLKWLFPFANSTVGWHYDKTFNITKFPLWTSFLYLLAVNMILYFLGLRSIKNKQLYLEVIADDRDK